MKPLILVAGFLLIGCVFAPEKDRIIVHEVPDGCMDQEDSTTWTDTMEGRHFSCSLDSTGR